MNFLGETKGFFSAGCKYGIEAELGKVAGHQITHGSIVVDHQNGVGPLIDRRQDGSNFVCLLNRFWRFDGDNRGKFKGEGRTDSGLAFYPDLAMHHVDESRTNRQTKSSSTILARNRTIGLCKVLEQIKLLLRGNADTCICNRESNAFLTVRGPALHLELNISVIRKLACIAEQIEKNLPNLRDVGMHASDARRK